MIPKIIHFCWLSDDPFPPEIERCVESWKKILPSYEIKRWDLNAMKKLKHPWLEEAFTNKKYAFAADYIRLFALYSEGGIYLDSDVEMLRPFDDLLERDYFIGRDSQGKIEAAIIGCIKGEEWIKDCLDYYAGRHFISEDGIMDTRPLPGIMEECISRNYKLISCTSPDAGTSTKEIALFPFDFFCCKRHDNGTVTTNSNSYSIHHFAGSWYTPKQRLASKAKHIVARMFGSRFAERLAGLLKR